MLDKKIANWITTALIGAAAFGGGLTVQDFNNPELSELEQITTLIAEKQEEYFNKNGKYWQGLKIDDRIPEGRITPTKLDSKPELVNESWANFVKLPETIPFQIEVHEYVSKEGAGYQIFFRKKEAGVVLIRAIGFGPEAETRTFNWREVKPLSP